MRPCRRSGPTGAELQRLGQTLASLTRRLKLVEAGRTQRRWFHTLRLVVCWRRCWRFGLRELGRRAGAPHRLFSLDFGPWSVGWATDRRED